MSDQDPFGPGVERKLERVDEAFSRLRDDAAAVEVGAALGSLQSRRSSWMRPSVVLGAAAAVLLIIVAVAVLDDDDPTTTASDDDSAPTATPTSDDGNGISLPGTSWVLVEGTTEAGPIPVSDDWPATLAFESTTAGGRAACNSYGGDYVLSDGSIRFGSIGSTEMACQEPAMTIESAFLGALGLVDTVRASSELLVLTGPGVELRFGLVEPLPSLELIGREWRLDTLITGETAATAAGEAATLLLSEGGSIEATTGCRSLTGEYVVSAERIVVTNLSADGECPSELAAQDNHVISVLTAGFAATIDGTRLTLTAPGAEGLSYTAVE